jgi:hypothetical protein
VDATPRLVRTVRLRRPPEPGAGEKARQKVAAG